MESDGSDAGSDEEESWTGARDSRNCPHGRGTLRLGKRARFEGRLCHGDRSGVGTLYVDEGDGGTSALRTTWVEDMPHGPGSFIEPTGGRSSGVWHQGELAGTVRE